MDYERMLDWLMPDLSASRAAAEAMRKSHPFLTPAQLADRAIRAARHRGAIAGAATGAASSPLTMIPAAMADAVAVLKIEANLVGLLAALLDPQALEDPHGIRADVIGVVFPAAASQALRQLGIRAGERLSQAVIRKYVSEDMLRTIVRLAVGSLGKTLTRDAIMTKAVPLVGMGIGAGWNWLEVRTIGRRAVRYFNREAIGPALLPAPPEEE